MSPLSSPKLKAHKRATGPSKSSTLWLRPFVLCLFISLWFLFSSRSRKVGLANISGSVEFGTHTTPGNSSLAPPQSVLAPLDPLFLPLGVAEPVDGPGVLLYPYSLTAVLPVTSSSFSALEATLFTLLEQPRYLSEVILVVPQSLHLQVRSILRKIVASGDSFAHVELSLAPWKSSASEDAAILDLARQVTTDFILCLDTTGLDIVDPLTREILMLFKPFPTGLPFGPHGLSSAASGSACMVPSVIPQPVAFLVPPLLIPSVLLSDTTFARKDKHDTWSALGRRIAESRADMVGGLAVGTEEQVADWCPLGQPATLSESPSQPFQKLQRLNEEHDVADNSSSSRQPFSSPGTFLLIFSSVQELHQFAVAACRLQRSGYLLHSLLYDDTLDSGTVSDHGTISLSQGDCHMKHSVFGSPGRTPAFGQLKDLALLTDVIIAISGYDRLSAALAQILAGYEENTPSVIQIPKEDLPYCDWMGTLTLQEWKNWHVPRVDVAVITNNRPRSLARLLSSLTSAHYFGDSLDVRINMEQTADVETLQTVNNFQWRHGRVFAHHRVVHGGLLTAVVESWYPRSDDTYGLLLEDDVELSPLFYAWLKMSLLRYRYGAPQNNSSQLFGISLYQQKHLELRPSGRHAFSARRTFAAAGLPAPHTPYLSQIPCSWGALYFPAHWREFHAFLGARLGGAPWAPDAPVVPGVRSNRWARSWKRFFIELAFLRGYVMLYPNFAGYASLSTNHLEAGAHVKDVPRETYLRKRRLFTLPLMPLPDADATGMEAPATGLLDLPDEELPPWASLPVLDLLGLLASEEIAAERGRLRRAELTRCTEPASRRHDVWDLLCLDDSPFASPTLGRNPEPE